MPEPDDEFQSGFPTRSHHDVFISYAQHDKPVADAICARLESRKIRCWIAPRDIPLAQDFPEAIVEAIEGAQVVVLVFSSHANTSPHVTRELTNAVNKARIIIPFRVEDVAPSKTMEYLIGVPHWLDAISPPLEKHIDQLADTVEQFLVRKTEIRCHACNTPLSPHARFCNACGAAVIAGTAGISDPATITDGSSVAGGEADPGSAEPAIPSPAEADASPAPVPLREDAVSLSAAQPPEGSRPDHAVSQETSPEVSSGVPGSSPARENTPMPLPETSRRSPILLVAGGILLVVILIALFAALPILSDSFIAAGTIPTIPVPASGSPGGVEPGTTIVLTTSPTQELPKDTELVIEAEKDVTNAKVTVRFSGGGGMGLVQDNTVILTRSDGTAVTGKLDFSRRSTEIALQGSRATDRLQVMVTMKSGMSYTIVDRLIPYRYFHET